LITSINGVYRSSRQNLRSPTQGLLTSS